MMMCTQLGQYALRFHAAYAQHSKVRTVRNRAKANMHGSIKPQARTCWTAPYTSAANSAEYCVTGAGTPPLRAAPLRAPPPPPPRLSDGEAGTRCRGGDGDRAWLLIPLMAPGTPTQRMFGNENFVWVHNSTHCYRLRYLGMHLLSTFDTVIRVSHVLYLVNLESIVCSSHKAAG